MRINKGDTIGDLSAIKVRDFLRQNRQFDIRNIMLFNFTSKSARQSKFENGDELTSKSSSSKLIKALLELGYIELYEYRRPTDKHDVYSITQQGITFSLATASKPIKRATADRLIKELLERVDSINKGDYLHSITKVQVFGSYLSDKELLSDVDVNISMKRRHEGDGYLKLNIERAKKSKRHFRTYVDFICWGHYEVEIILKNKSTGLSLHVDDPIVEISESRTIFELKEEQIK